jgi:hypothetical protein
MSCRIVEIRFLEAPKIDYFADHSPVFPAGRGYLFWDAGVEGLTSRSHRTTKRRPGVGEPVS